MTDAGPPDVPEGDAAEQRQAARPEQTDREETDPAGTGSAPDDLPGRPAEADEADVMDQYLEAGDDDEDR